MAEAIETNGPDTFERWLRQFHSERDGLLRERFEDQVEAFSMNRMFCKACSLAISCFTNHSVQVRRAWEDDEWFANNRTRVYNASW